MKKTLLALMVAGVASTAGAAEIMSAGNVSVTTDADFEVALEYDEKSGDIGINYDGAEIAFAAESIINENWTAFLKYGLEMPYDDTTVVSQDIVAGFKFYNNHKIEFGKTSHVIDLGSNESKKIGLDISNDELPGVNDIIVYEYTGQALSAGLSHDFDIETGDEATSTTVYLGGDFGAFSIRGDFGYGSDDAPGLDDDGIIKPSDVYIYGLKGSFGGEAFSIGAAYTGSTSERDNLEDAQAMLFDLWAGFGLIGLDWKVGGQYIDITDYKGAAGVDADATAYYLNGSYALNDVVGFWAEVGYLDTDALEDAGVGASVGMTMSF